MAGSTNYMQCRHVNGVVTVSYTDGSSETLSLVNPENWAPIEQDFYFDGLAFKSNAPRPYRVVLSSGLVSNQLEKDLNSQQAEAFMSHLSPLLEDLRDGGFTIQYCISVLSDIAVATYGYMLRSQLDTWIVFGYDIREYAKQIDSIDSYREWMHQVIDTIYRSIRERDENVDSDIRQQIELIISKEIENDISLSLIADRLGMKPYELSRTFTKIMGKNYIDYIKDRKLLKAIEFLRGGMAVQDIAKRLGYRSPQYFIRIFKENYGTTPYQYRKTVLDAEER